MLLVTCIPFPYLSRVASFSDANKMPRESLAKIFGPTIVGHGSSRPDPSVQWKDAEKQPKVHYMYMHIIQHGTPYKYKYIVQVMFVHCTSVALPTL